MGRVWVFLCFKPSLEKPYIANWKCDCQGFLWNYLISLHSTQIKILVVNGTQQIHSLICLNFISANNFFVRFNLFFNFSVNEKILSNVYWTLFKIPVLKPWRLHNWIYCMLLINVFLVCINSSNSLRNPSKKVLSTLFYR